LINGVSITGSEDITLRIAWYLKKGSSEDMSGEVASWLIRKEGKGTIGPWNRRHIINTISGGFSSGGESK
jgi:hypothetical protein